MEESRGERRVAILGGGVAGLSAAWKLAERGLGVDLYEAAPALGGMAGSWERNGYTWDFGPHRFHTKNQAILDAARDPDPVGDPGRGRFQVGRRMACTAVS